MDQRKILAATTALLGCVMMMGVSGCGNSGPELHKVSGTLILDGSPAPDMVVTFLPTDDSRASVGMTDADGRFTLFFTGEEEGVQPGEHIVCIRSASPEPDALTGSLKALAEKYGSEDSSPCRITIDKDEENLEVKLD